MGFKATAVGLAVTGIIVTSGGHAGSLGPERVVEALIEHVAQDYNFIVSLHPTLKPEMAPPMDGHRVENVVDLPLLNGFAATMQAVEAFRLAEMAGVEWVWHLHPDEAELTQNVVLSLEYALSQGALVTNMSLSPPSDLYQKKPDFNAPVPRATLKMARQGRLVVTPIGDAGSDMPGFVNPWSTPPWVLSVGAWDHRTNTVWEHSSKGDPTMPNTWPDVIAPGVNVIEPMTTTRAKTDAERANDEGNAGFRKNVPKAAWESYTMRSGSGVAAAQVTNAAEQVAFFLTGIIKERNPQEGEQLFSIAVGPERITAQDKVVSRLTGRATSTLDGGMEYAYWLDQPWKMIKQILIDTALPVPNAQPWEVGAGVVDPVYIRAEFGTYGISNSQIMAAKILE